MCRFDDETIKVVAMAGFKEARTTRILNLFPAKESLMTPATIHTYPYRSEYNGRPITRVFYEYIERAWENSINYGHDVVFHLWGHGWEISKFNMWDELEDMLKELSKLKKRYEEYAKKSQSESNRIKKNISV